jgi:glycosyltransferase involved in cell wall biosynthesis
VESCSFGFDYRIGARLNNAKLLRRKSSRLEVCYRGRFLHRLNESARKYRFSVCVSECCSVNIMLGEGSCRSIMAIIAALDEEEGIGPTIVELQKHLGNLRLLVVDGKSRDRTVEIAKGLNAEVVLQEGKGKGDAIAVAIREVKDNPEYVVLTDADYTYPADFVPEMIGILDNNPNIGMVCGNRFNSHFRMDYVNNLFYFGNRFLAFTHNLMNGVNLRDPLTGLRVVRWEILKDWKPKSKGFDIEVELNHYVERRGYKIREISIPYRPRLGEKKLKLRHGLTIVRRIMAEASQERARSSAKYVS